MTLTTPIHNEHANTQHSWLANTRSEPKQPSLQGEIVFSKPCFLQPGREIAHLVPTMALLQPSLTTTRFTAPSPPPTHTHLILMQNPRVSWQSLFFLCSAQYDVTKSVLYVAVLGRNQTLFCCVFRLCYHIQSTVAQYSVKGGAHMRSETASMPDKSTQHVWALPLTEVLRYSTLNPVTRPKYAMEQCSISTRDCHISGLKVEEAS